MLNGIANVNPPGVSSATEDGDRRACQAYSNSGSNNDPKKADEEGRNGVVCLGNAIAALDGTGVALTGGSRGSTSFSS
jgi:hypothetical protein